LNDFILALVNLISLSLTIVQLAFGKVWQQCNAMVQNGAIHMGGLCGTNLKGLGHAILCNFV